VLTRKQIEAAASRISDRVRTTPVISLEKRVFGLPVPVSLKLELLQHTGSFKPRGAFNRMLSQRVPDGGVIAASGGNHGLAVAYAARQIGVRAEVFVPETAAPVKVARLRGYGAQVTQVGQRYADAYASSQRRAAQTGAMTVHAYDQWEVAAGQGTVAKELESQLPDLDTVVVAVGGGGLIGGISSWFDGRVRVVAVEPVLIPTLATALKCGEPVDVDVQGIAADSLGARRISADTLAVCQRTSVESVLVTDKAISVARRALWDETRVAAEFGGACALAALMSGAYEVRPGERVAVVVCGGNTDPRDLEQGAGEH
jgi:threonine dehydratase